MPRIITATLRYFSQHEKNRFAILYGALLLLSLHTALVVYLNASFLAAYVSEEIVSALYIVGSFIALVLFFYMPHLLKTIGNYKSVFLFAFLEMCAVFGMAFSQSAFLAVSFFLFHFILIPLILFNIDIFIEKFIGNQEKQTGSKRGLYLSLMSLTAAIGPLLAGHLIPADGGSFAPAYLLSAIILLPFLLIITIFFRNFEDAQYSLLSVKNMLSIFTKQIDTRNIVLVSVVLQLFFTWTVIYMPLYLATVAQFSWKEIGLIMFVGLSAYVIFEYPIGIIADKYIGEKEMMAFGFVLIAVSTSWFAFIPHAGIGIWMIAMFLTRVGASFVETTSESFFFKHTGSIDTHKISLFRMTRPLSAILGATIGSIGLLYMEFNLLFIVFGFCMIPGLIFTMMLRDTQ